MKTATLAELVGAKIRLHRLARNMTQEQLAESIGMAGTYLAQIERGEKNVKLNTIEKITAGLHITVYDLFDEKEGNLQENKWVWASILILLQQDEGKQRQAHRLLKALFENDENE
ncbi:helix-turn-helix domain-containing protein [Cohnella cellulosilytica]|uniref:Helix-turn-helix domain-containing protein n=1 Tax=Cohnella cellulosilytica TaxID=986710 RepID=A0ABW2FMW6_9BACL